MSTETLTPRRAKFASEYLIDLNATQAAIRAGYSPHTAKQQGSRLLTDVDVSRAISQRQHELAERHNVDADRVLAEYARIAFSDITNYRDVFATGEIDFGSLPLGMSAAIADLVVDTSTEKKDVDARRVRRVRVRLHNKLTALEALAKHLGLFAPDRREITSIPDTSALKNWTIAQLVAGIEVMKSESEPTLGSIDGVVHDGDVNP
jgi:phage terminase small subunit